MSSLRLLPISGRDPDHLTAVSLRLIDWLDRAPDFDSVVQTLVAAPAERHRRVVIARGVEEASAALKTRDSTRLLEGVAGHPKVVFLFPGQGTQRHRMLGDAWETHSRFRETFESYAQRLQSQLGLNLADLIYGQDSDPDRLDETLFAQTSLFAIELALAELLSSWGIKPQAMCGHSIGELVSACLSNVFETDDAFNAVASRARFMQRAPRGAMLAVRACEREGLELAGTELDLAAINGPQQVVIAGSNAAVERLEARCGAKGIATQRLATSHGFHSRLMESAAEPFIEGLSRLRLNAPRIPFISNVTGTWITESQVTDPNYWGQQLVQTVRFGKGLQTLLDLEDAVWVEVGPGETLTRLLRQTSPIETVTCVTDEADGPLRVAARLWTLGSPLEWSALTPEKGTKLDYTDLFAPPRRLSASSLATSDPDAIAIVGMSGRFPGAQTLGALWENLRDGVESITFFEREEMLECGVSPESIDDPTWVNAAGVLDKADMFDGAFFGMTPREAAETDPQQRLFLECAWEALEHSGYDPSRFPGRIGVFASSSPSTYFLSHLTPELARQKAGFVMESVVGHERDFLPTRVSYKLDLQGPSVNVQTACSSSLVALHLACQSLLNGECEMALVGGVSVRVPQRTGYSYRQGGIMSPDGHCRAFDSQAAGTVLGAGVGVVALRSLAPALADRSTVYAIVRGTAINNDGARKVGFTAPSIDAQAAVMREALAAGGIAPESVSYVETHGTGTYLGDPSEFAAIRQAYGNVEDPAIHPCALGSVKTNIGHLDAAAGIAGILKVTLALDRGFILPSLHFNKPHPEIDVASTRFRIAERCSEWTDPLRRCGVSSFGIGGTNAHAVLEEGVRLATTPSSNPWRLLVWSARTESSLEVMRKDLGDHLETSPSDLDDIAWTLWAGRRRFECRQALICRDREDALLALRTNDRTRLLESTRPGEPSKFEASAKDPDVVCSELERLALQWLSGEDVPLEAMYPVGTRRRVPLPTYPFERRRYWLESSRPRPRSFGLEEWSTTEQENSESVSVAVHRRPDLRNPYVAPRNLTESRLADLVKDLLGFRRVGICDSFFELGGHSLQAVQLVSSVRADFGSNVALDAFLKEPTIKRLAELVTEAAPIKGDGDALEALLQSVEALTPDEARVELDELGGTAAAEPQSRSTRFSLFFFSGDEAAIPEEKYRLVLEAARFADDRDFEAVWTPERHFHRFGGLYPNPSVLGAALATITERIGIRAGSVVLPIHSPIRVAEEWAVVDNLSGGRVGMGLASGFHPYDFILSGAPDAYQERHQRLFESVVDLQTLWGGGTYEGRSGSIDRISVRTFPRPVQSSLPIWIAAGGNVATFTKAGRMGFHVLTALLQMTRDQLEERIAAYRLAREQADLDPETGCVTVMLHTYVGNDDDSVRRVTRDPFLKYLQNHTELVNSQVTTLGRGVAPSTLPKEDEEALLEYAFERYLTDSSLMGSVQTCAQRVRELARLGVNEIACLIDFGINFDLSMKGLERLDALRRIVTEATGQHHG